MNLLTKILIGAGAVTGISYLVKLKRTSSEMETIATARIQKLELPGLTKGKGGLTIRVDVQIKNPTQGSLKIKYPFVKLMYGGSPIGSSQVINKDIEIPSYGEARIEGIMIEIPLLQLLSFGVSALKALKDNTGIKILVKTISTIELGFRSIPYEKTDPITLKK
jgi:hypothetical protein